jgi:N-acetylmuramoyl-L-alanine amidase
LKNSYSSQRVARWSAALFLSVLASAPAFAGGHKSEARGAQQFAGAERMREALNGRPAKDRTRHDYQQAIDAYRRVYYTSPTSTKADPSVVAVAELMVEMGRRFDDDDILRKAIKQYQFLRREYPGSKYRFDALFTVGEIYKDDLDDSAHSKAAFEEFLRRYPRNHLANDARKALDDEKQQAALNASVNAAEKSSDATSESTGKSSPDKASSGKGSDSAAAEKAEPLPRVTGIRHWSTPDYTRVAIDLEQEVKFESQRITHPERIFFDLTDTKLASTLVGKTFDVDDGFLKKIRVAQFARERTRVVLEVDDLSDYNAFLLTNPPRLIIDVHGRDVHAKDVGGEDAQTKDVHGNQDEKPSATTEESTTPPTVISDTAKPTLGPVVVKAAPRSPSDEAKPGTKPAFQARSNDSAIKRKIVDSDDASDDSAADPSLDSTVADQSAAAPASSHSKLHLSKSVHEARPTANGDRSLIRALGLKIGKIVIDPGHGGYDTGTIGPNGLREKDLVLDVSKRLGKLLEARLGAEVDYTRRDDTFIPLETRTALANQDQADLFISVHANSSSDPYARGVETYYLNFSSSPEALEVAARENAVSEKSIHELQDLVKKIALKEKIDESREFASDVESALHSGLVTKSPGMRDGE